MFGVFRFDKGAEKISVVLSTEARCLGVFQYFLNLFDTGLIYATKAPKKISIILSKEARGFSVFWFAFAKSDKDDLKQFLRR